MLGSWLTIPSANWGEPDLARYSHEWPDIRPSGQLEFARRRLARQAQVRNLGTRSAPLIPPTGQISRPCVCVWPDLPAVARQNIIRYYPNIISKINIGIRFPLPATHSNYRNNNITRFIRTIQESLAKNTKYRREASKAYQRR